MSACATLITATVCDIESWAPPTKMSYDITRTESTVCAVKFAGVAAVTTMISNARQRRAAGELVAKQRETLVSRSFIAFTQCAGKTSQVAPNASSESRRFAPLMVHRFGQPVSDSLPRHAHFFWHFCS
jgi:hypothetical protein